MSNVRRTWAMAPPETDVVRAPSIAQGDVRVRWRGWPAVWVAATLAVAASDCSRDSAAAPSPIIRPSTGSVNPSAPAPALPEPREERPRFRYYRSLPRPEPPVLPPDRRLPLVTQEGQIDKRVCVYDSHARTAEPADAADLCAVEILETLRIEFEGGKRPSRISVSGPAGFSRVLPDDQLDLDIGMPTGDYTFEATVDGRMAKGRFLVERASQRAVIVKGSAGAIDRIAMAGFQPGSIIRLYDYEQVAYAPSAHGGTRTWRLRALLGRVTANKQGEATLTLSGKRQPLGSNRLIVTWPRQENDLNAARIDAGR